jgi:hypothetical protein
MDAEKVSIYILELEGDKYYVGRSKKKTEKGVQSRIKQHYDGGQMAAAWCKKYPPISTVDIKYDMDKWDENKWTKIYMEKYGIENVRGGDYVRIKLPKKDIEFLEKEINGSNDLCHKCGQSGHFIRFCPNSSSSTVLSQAITVGKQEIEDNVDNGDDTWVCIVCNGEFDTESSAEWCVTKHEVLNNLCARFKTFRFGYIEELCAEYNYHGGFVSRVLRRREERQCACY